MIVLGVWTYFRVLLGRATAVTLENVALRHQLAILQRSVPRPRLRRRDRIFWVCLSHLWALAGQPPHCSARDRACLAPSRLPALLALEVPSPPCGSAAARS
jgi:hypothetical protein